VSRRGYYGLIGLLALGCVKTPAAPTADTVAAELVEAGCIQSSVSLPTSVEVELHEDGAPAWIGCLFEGGTVAGCSVPCDSSTTVIMTKRP
jgi:hypothetical protein